MMNKLLGLILLSCTLSTFAVQKNSGLKQVPSGLFVHLDKSVYLNNETIWFSAYLLMGKSNNQQQHKLLHVVLSRADSDQVLVEEKYLLTGGFSTGKLMLPDSLKSGKYQLFAYTNVLDSNLRPAVWFKTTLILGNQFREHTNVNFNTLPDRTQVSYLKAELSTDQQEYVKRGLVKVKVKLQDVAGLPLQGLFSVAVVHHTRLTGREQKITENYFYAEPKGINYKEIIPNALVKYKNKTLQKPIDVVVFGNKGISILSSDDVGKLNMTWENFLSPYGKKIAMMVSGSKHKDYQIVVNDQMLQAGVLLAKEQVIPLSDTILNYLPRQQVAMEKVFELNAVTVKGNNRSNASFKGKPGINDCGDWVDEFDYLNYPYSEKRYQPVVGKQYKKRTDLGNGNNWFKVEPIYYSGCEISTNTVANLFKGVNLESPFYGLDKSSSGLQYLTTLFWAGDMLTHKNGEAEFTFTTADLTGDYTIVLQGITTDQVTYGKVGFTVTPN